MHLSKGLVKFFLVIFLLTQFWGLSLLFPEKLDSANLTNVSDSLSNNRLSFRGELSGAHAAGTAVITLNTSSSPGDSRNTSTGSAALMENETIQVGANNPANTVKTIESASRIVLSAGITNAQNDDTMVVATSSAVHTVTFTPVSTVASGAFRVLIPAASAASNDGFPDSGGFDFSTTAPTVSCLGGGSNISFTGISGTASPSAVQVSTTWYHSFECRYNGTGATPAAVTMYIGTPNAGKLINPAPAATTCGGTPQHCPGQADTYTFRARQAYGTAQSYANVDETLGTIGVVEAVRVTATVSPILTFQISGRAASSVNCGQSQPSTVTTTYNTVPFGTSVTTTAFADAGQQLVISTNAAGGYSVTASESGLLTAHDVTGAPTIPDTTCQATPCTTTIPQTWTVATYKGFGYALQDVAGDSVEDTKEYTNGYRPFGTTGVQIMRANPAGPVDSDIAYTCYRIVVSGTQAAGDYENYVIYIATATF